METRSAPDSPALEQSTSPPAAVLERAENPGCPDFRHTLLEQLRLLKDENRCLRERLDSASSRGNPEPAFIGKDAESQTASVDPEKLLMLEHIRILDLENRNLRAQRRERSVAECPTCCELRQEVEECREENVRLQKQIRELQNQLEVAKERLNQNSSNSSTPPSKDPPNRYPKKRRKSGMKPGGQPDHPGSYRKPLPEDQVVVEDHYPEVCDECGCGLPSEKPAEEGREKFRSHQVTALPELPAVKVIEHRLHPGRCPRCKRVTYAKLPPGVPAGSFSPQFEALVCLLTGGYPLSRRDAVSLMRDMFGAHISLGAVKAMEQRMTQALKAPVAEAKESVKHAPRVSNDATGWKINGKRNYTFVSVTPDVITYDITAKHNSDEVLKILGPDFKGILTSDRSKIYDVIPAEQRQICLAHGDRDFHKMLDRGGESKPIGEQGVALGINIFHQWHRHKAGELSREQLQKEFEPIEESMKASLQAGTTCCQHNDKRDRKDKKDDCIHKKTQRTCQNMLDLFPAFWSFVRHEDVEPTNNISEQNARRVVKKRVQSYGSKSEAGNRYIESMMTVSATLPRKGRNPLAFLTAAAVALLTGGPAPSLLGSKDSPEGPQPSTVDADVETLHGQTEGQLQPREFLPATPEENGRPPQPTIFELAEENPSSGIADPSGAEFADLPGPPLVTQQSSPEAPVMPAPLASEARPAPDLLHPLQAPFASFQPAGLAAHVPSPTQGATQLPAIVREPTKHPVPTVPGEHVTSPARMQRRTGTAAPRSCTDHPATRRPRSGPQRDTPAQSAVKSVLKVLFRGLDFLTGQRKRGP